MEDQPSSSISHSTAGRGSGEECPSFNTHHFVRTFFLALREKYNPRDVELCNGYTAFRKETVDVIGCMYNSAKSCFTHERLRKDRILQGLDPGAPHRLAKKQKAEGDDSADSTTDSSCPNSFSESEDETTVEEALALTMTQYLDFMGTRFLTIASHVTRSMQVNMANSILSSSNVIPFAERPADLTPEYYGISRSQRQRRRMLNQHHQKK